MLKTTELNPQGGDGTELNEMIVPQEANVACCNWAGRLVFPAVCIVAVVAICLSAFLGGALYERSQQPNVEPAATVVGPAEMLPLIQATSAVTSEKFSIATGAVSENADGLFLLDHNSGLLQCSVIYPRLGKFMGQFTVNVADALGIGRKGSGYIMVTGRADFPRSSNNPAASSVVYVLDTATGNYACYGIPFNRVAMNANRSQQGVMVLLSTGTANPVIDRDSLR